LTAVKISSSIKKQKNKIGGKIMGVIRVSFNECGQVLSARKFENGKEKNDLLLLRSNSLIDLSNELANYKEKNPAKQISCIIPIGEGYVISFEDLNSS
jgi:hypothetical protein